MEFVVKNRTSESEQKKFKLISFTHLQFIVSYHKAVVNHKLYSEKTNISEKIFFRTPSKLWDYWARRKFLSENLLIFKRIKCIFEKIPTIPHFHSKKSILCPKRPLLTEKVIVRFPQKSLKTTNKAMW